MQLPIYLDNAATTPVDPRVAEKMLFCLRENFGNSASNYIYGQQAAELIATARQQVADLIVAAPREIIFTSGATESINLALKGVAYANQDKGRHIITCQSEHSAVLNCCAQLAKENFRITYLTPEKSGLIDLNKLAAALQPDTILVSLQHANNEIGVLQDIAAISELTRERGVLLHVDAAQSVGKVPINLQQLNIDLMSFSAHKLYGPKGVGALFVRQLPRVHLQAQMQGGGQEFGLRAGTLATHQIVGIGETLRLANLEMLEDAKRITHLHDQLWRGISELDEIYLNGDANARVPGILNVAFAELNTAQQTLLSALPDLAVSAGSACRSNLRETSHVLRSIGLHDELARNSIRFSLGKFTTEEEIEFAVVKIHEAVQLLRK